MKKHFFIVFILICVCCFSSFAKGNNNSNNNDKEESNPKEIKSEKMSDKVDLKVNIKAEAEVSLVDTADDKELINIGIAKNEPEFNTEATVFAKILFPKHENLILGPVGNTAIKGKMDHHKVMTSATKSREIFYFEEGDFFNYAGIKFGTKFGKQYFTDSSFTITIPFLFEFQVNNSNDISIPSEPVIDYYTHLLLGTNIIADLKIKSKPLHFGFDIKNTLKIAADVSSISTKEAFQYLFITSKNEFSFHIKPFNFINNKVDVEFKGYFRSFVEFTGENLQLKKRTYFAISWDGLKYFGLRYKPIIYNDESNYQFVDVSAYKSIDDFVSYYNYYNFSTEFAIFFGNKYFNIEISYELPYYTIDDSAINTDSVREHKITTAVEVKF